MNPLSRLIHRFLDHVEYVADKDDYKQVATRADGMVEAANAAVISAGKDRPEAQRQLAVVTAFKDAVYSRLNRAPEEKQTELCRAFLKVEKAYFDWCSATDLPAACLRRHEGFWNFCASIGDGWGDDYHRPCAFKLARLYATAGDAKKSVEM